MKTLPTIAVLLALALTSVSSEGQRQQQHERNQITKYPNELSGFRFYEKAKWKTLQPLASTMADVRRVLGEPTEAHDVSQYTKPYPGDAVAKKPVFTYELDDDWKILVYFVRYCFYEGLALPASLDNRLCSIDLLPRKRLSFKKVIFAQAFKKQLETAPHGEWDEYADGSGLVYEVFTRKTAYGDERPGDLNRIKYGPSVEALRRYASK